jgi:cephalosporin hydroxylase
MVEASRSTVPLTEAWLEGGNDGGVLYRRFLYRLCKLAGVEVAIEMGIWNGCTTLHLAGGAKRAVIGVDIDIARPRLLENAGVWQAELPGKLHLVKGDSTAPETVGQVAAILDSLKAKANLLFIDTIHTYSQAIAEFQAYKPLLAPRALVAMDDTLDPPDEVYRAFQEIPGEHLELNHLHMSEDWRNLKVGFGLIILD